MIHHSSHNNRIEREASQFLPVPKKKLKLSSWKRPWCQAWANATHRRDIGESISIGHVGWDAWLKPSQSEEFDLISEMGTETCRAIGMAELFDFGAQESPKSLMPHFLWLLFDERGPRARFDV